MELDVSVNYLDIHFPAYLLFQHLKSVLMLCQRLQSVQFTGQSSGGGLHAGELVVEGHWGACLHRLSLSDVNFQLVDLQNAIFLTNLELHNVDASPGFTRMLPPRVQSFAFTGRSLFAPQARHMLLACTCMNKLVITGTV